MSRETEILRVIGDKGEMEALVLVHECGVHNVKMCIRDSYNISPLIAHLHIKHHLTNPFNRQAFIESGKMQRFTRRSTCIKPYFPIISYFISHSYLPLSAFRHDKGQNDQTERQITDLSLIHIFYTRKSGVQPHRIFKRYLEQN